MGVGCYVRQLDEVNMVNILNDSFKVYQKVNPTQSHIERQEFDLFKSTTIQSKTIQTWGN